ncbi:MAG: efflux transporter periplasmic adaptor subunit [Croceicoccus sp.]|nr:efflux transporter periplasmic adaptor subunit [Croceicoccus sp.]MAL25469.1 efflux transporter periplasmic adaptor subunit [Croceicoccus sp.]|tara:strand:- start:49791 stop:50993 length:1203 start_codon:yes stop_codon:yes gene_type:complete
MRLKTLTLVLSALAPLTLAAGCDSGVEEAAAPSAVPVRTYTVTAGDMPNIVELPGRVAAIRTAEVRARVTGIVQRRLYTEGTDVGEGQPLFRIDPSELQASYAQSEASLDRAKATAANARAVVERYRPLVDENAISRQEYDAAVAAMREADANVAQLRAQLRAAGLQLGYTTVRAPISGRAGRAQVTEGALVSQPEGTLLTTVEQIDRVYVTFNQSATELLRTQRAIASGEIDLPDRNAIDVQILFPDGSAYPITGKIDFLAVSVQETTGTVEVRAEVPNPNYQLLPGEFVRGRVTVGTRRNAVSVPQAAVMLADDGGSVYVVGKDGMVEARKVTLGEMVEGRWIVESGLRPGDEVIVSRLQTLRPGMPVTVANTPTGQQAPAAKSPAAKAVPKSDEGAE